MSLEWEKLKAPSWGDGPLECQGRNWTWEKQWVSKREKAGPVQIRGFGVDLIKEGKIVLIKLKGKRGANPTSKKDTERQGGQNWTRECLQKEAPQPLLDYLSTK